MVIDVEIEEGCFLRARGVGQESGEFPPPPKKRVKRRKSGQLTRLRSAVLPLAPASPLLRFVNPPTLLPILLLKTPLLPELDMAACDYELKEDAIEIIGESQGLEWEDGLRL